MRRLFTIALLLALAVITASAQRKGCVIPGDRAETRGSGYFLPDPYDFDPNKIYRQPVVLVTFDDQDFSMADPQSFYARVCNENGYRLFPGAVRRTPESPV